MFGQLPEGVKLVLGVPCWRRAWRPTKAALSTNFLAVLAQTPLHKHSGLSAAKLDYHHRLPCTFVLVCATPGRTNWRNCIEMRRGKNRTNPLRVMRQAGVARKVLAKDLKLPKVRRATCVTKFAVRRCVVSCAGREHCRGQRVCGG